MAGIDISLLGDEALSKLLARLSGPVQRRVVSKAMRASAKRIQGHVVSNLSGSPVHVRSGDLRAAFSGARVRAGKGKRGVIRLGIEWPTRDKLGIAADDPYFYPTAIEYGHARASAKPFMRPAVDDHESEEHRRIGSEIGAGIESEAGRT